MSQNFFLDNADLQYHFENTDWGALLDAMGGSSDDSSFKNANELKEQARELLTLLGKYVACEIAPYAHELDHQTPMFEAGEVYDSPRMKKIMRGLKDVGAMGISLPSYVGGLNMPTMVSNMLAEMLSRADVSVMTYYGFYLGPALSLLSWSCEEGSTEFANGRVKSSRFEEQVKRIASGDEFGAMVLTEPQAGSDLAQIHTKAALGADGTWRISGQKIWITCGHGEHNIVLARTEDSKGEPGLKGLSLFYVPAHIDSNGKRVRNIEIGGAEKKMGQHSSVTVTLNFNDSVGELIGTRGHGFRYMSLLMNNARLYVGFEGIGLCEAALRLAKEFAAERVTMGKPIAQHEIIKEYLDGMETSLLGLRALSYEAALHEEIAAQLKLLLKRQTKMPAADRKQIESKIQKMKRRARLSTPLVKYAAGEDAVYMARMAMQIMGGSGYMQEYGAEKLLRDSLVIPIYEGTSQIQSLMALKDHLQAAMRNPAKFLARSAKARLESFGLRDEMELAFARVKNHYFTAIQTILTRILTDKLGDLKGRPILEWKEKFLASLDPKKDLSFGLLHAERFTRIAVQVSCGRALVEQARKAAKTKDEAARREIAIRYLKKAEIICRQILLEIA